MVAPQIESLRLSRGPLAENRRGPTPENPLRRLSRWVGSPSLVLLALLLIVAGTAAVYAATYAGLLAAGASPNRYVVRNGVNALAAAAIGVALCWFGYRRAAQFSLVAYGLTVAALLAVLTPLGSRINGASAWFDLGPVQLEPSQISVLVLVVFTAQLLGAPGNDAAKRPGLRTLLPPLGAAGLVIVLILSEPALGLAFVVVAVFAGLLALSGMSKRALAALVVLAVLAVPAGLALHVVKPYQQQRLSSFLHPTAATSTGFQTIESMIAVGSGGVEGQGLLNGTQTNGSFVPEQRTDFIFTVVAEETGFVGSGVLLALLGGLCWTALRIAGRAPDRLGQMVAGGIAVWFAAQTFVNVGMATGILPVTGIPLPFISYGGSGLFVDVAAVGLLCSVAREQRSGSAG